MPKSGSINLRTILLYATPNIAAYAVFAPMPILQGVYAKHYGLSLSAIAIVVLASRLFDAVSDPVVGYVSDRARLKYGTRKPVIAAGAISMALSAMWLYSPAGGMTIYHFAASSLLFYLGVTLFFIPHTAWAVELTQSTENRMLIFKILSTSGYLGMLAFYAVPALPVWETTEITPDTLALSALVAVFLLAISIPVCLRFVPNGHIAELTPAETNKRESWRATLLATVRMLARNKPFLCFAAAYMFGVAGAASWYSLAFIYIDAYLVMGRYFSNAFIISIFVGAVSPFIWASLALRIGQKSAWLFAIAICAAIFAGAALLRPETVTFVHLALLLSAFIFCSSCMDVIPKIQLSTIVDYSNLRFKLYRGSTMFAVVLFLTKSGNAIGAALGLLIAGSLGFDPTSTNHAPSAVTGLKLAMMVPALALLGVSAVFVVLQPIGKRERDIISKRTEQLKRRSTSVPVQSGVATSEKKAEYEPV